MIGGPYALLAVGVVVAGLSLTSYALYQRGEAANARADAAQERVAALTQTVQEQEADKEALRVAAEMLDAAIVQRDRRQQELEATKRALQREINELKRTLPEADQACLDRALPDALAERLLNDRADDRQKDGKAARP